MTTGTADAAYEALMTVLSAGSVDGLIDIRRAEDSALLVFRWPPYADLFGVELSLVGPDYWLDVADPAGDLDEWIATLPSSLIEEIDTGLLYRGRRRQGEGCIELHGPDWPSDKRFYVDVVHPGDEDAWARTEFVAADGLDPARAVAAREAGILVAWVTAYENNSAGAPYVGQGIVIGETPDRARLDQVEVVAGTPSTLVVDLVRAATHAAAGSGAATVTTRLQLEHLELLGFRSTAAGEYVAATNFLSEDADAADAVFEAALAEPGSWGGDRDRAGRYLPRTRAGRLIHRLRFGRSGSRPRVYAASVKSSRPSRGGWPTTAR
ncbi:MAG: hypothetical protein J2P23_12945 [Microlunatus sp.]|nr:hypothetical protein [Microlunatus sp.]